MNEEKNLETTVHTILRALSTVLEDYEVVIVNDGSTDRTPDIVDQLARDHTQVQFVHHPRRMGLGKAYLSAVDVATKNYFVFIPGDNSWPFESVLELFRHLGAADVVTSYATNPAARRGGLARRFVSEGYTVMLNVLHGLDLRYYNGLTIYPTVFLRTKPIQTFGFGFAAEALLHAVYRGMSYLEIGVPIQELEGGISKAVTVKNIASVMVTVVRCFWKLRIRRAYGNRQRGRRVSNTVS